MPPYSFKQIAHLHLERLDELLKCTEGRVLSAALESGEVFPRDPRLSRQGILREIPLRSEPFEPHGKSSLCHGYCDLKVTRLSSGFFHALNFHAGVKFCSGDSPPILDPESHFPRQGLY